MQSAFNYLAIIIYLLIQSCDTHLCVTTMCNIQRLSTDGVTFTVEFNVDERFYASVSRVAV